MMKYGVLGTFMHGWIQSWSTLCARRVALNIRGSKKGKQRRKLNANFLYGSHSINLASH
jgi:hypothetical protein